MSQHTTSNTPGWTGRVRKALTATVVTMLAAVGLVAVPTSATADVETDQWYVIESAHSGLVFDIADQSTEGGALLTQYTRWDGQNCNADEGFRN